MSNDDLAWGTVTPRRCRRHEWSVHPDDAATVALINGWGTEDRFGNVYPTEPPVYVVPRCIRCGVEKDDAASLRGKRNRSRGNAIERDVARQLGLRRVGQYGGPEDVSGEAFVVQVKSGKSFPERIYRWLKALPANAGQTPLVVITDAPGPGHRRRALVVLTLEDWIALHGPVEEEA